MTLNPDLYTQITLPTLFLQPPAPPTQITGTGSIDTILTTIKELSDTKPYSQLITITHLTRHIIINTIPTEKSIPTIFALWEIHLTALQFAKELSLAQQEAKRLSIALDSIVKTKSTSKPSKTHQSAFSFPENTPLSLKLLVVRLRSGGPSVQSISEAYTLLWEQRHNFLKEDRDEEQKKFCKDVMRVLSYGIAACLIAKREYGTFLTIADSVDNNNMIFVAVLVSLMKGDWDAAYGYFEDLKDFDYCVSLLKDVLKTVNPVLDPNKEDTGSDHDLTIENLDDLFELIKTQTVTGRIVCGLCAMFELDLRDESAIGKDILRGNLEPIIEDATTAMFKLWRDKSSRFYAFE